MIDVNVTVRAWTDPVTRVTTLEASSGKHRYCIHLVGRWRDRALAERELVAIVRSETDGQDTAIPGLLAAAEEIQLEDRGV